MTVNLRTTDTHIYTKKEFVDLLGIVPNGTLRNIFYYLCFGGTIVAAGTTIICSPWIFLANAIVHPNGRAEVAAFTIGLPTVAITSLALLTYLTRQSSHSTKELLEKALASSIFEPNKAKVVDENEFVEKFIFFDEIKAAKKANAAIELCITQGDKETVIPLNI